MTRSAQRFILASAVILIGALIVAALIFVNIPDRNENILNVALGLLLGWGGSVIGFYFGSSDSSDRKTELMAKDGPTGRPNDPVYVEEER